MIAAADSCGDRPQSPTHLKIAHILPALTKGGAERVTVELANHAARAGHEVSVVLAYPVDDHLLRHELDQTITVLYVGNRPARLAPYLAILPWIARHRPWLQTQDILHCHLTFGAFFGMVVQGLRRISWRRKPQVVETIHSVGMPIPKFSRWAHGAVAVSRDALVLMANDVFWDGVIAGRKGRKVSATIENGVRTDLAPPETARSDFRREHGFAQDEFIVGTIGRLVPARRPWLITKAFAVIGRHMPTGVSFLIGGDGVCSAQVSESLAAGNIADRTLMLGLVNDTRAPLAALDLYVTLNVGAVTGIAALEAVAAGLPVVALQLLDEHRGCQDWIWSDTDPQAVAEHCLELLRDPPMRAALAARQRAHLVVHRSVDSMATAYYGVYDAARRAAGTASRND